jgi:drug/metabolite transporter (DMT)-like permease
MLPALLTTVFFSISASCATRSTRILGGLSANFWRLVLATLVLALWTHGFGTGFGGPSFRFFFLSGLIGFGLGDLALYQALPRLGSRLAILLNQCVAAPFAALVEWHWLDTRITGLQMLAGAAILAGVAVALVPDKTLKIQRRDFWPGILFGLLAAGGQGGGAVVSRKAYAIAQTAGQTVDGGTAAYERILGGLIIGTLAMVIVSLLARMRTSKPMDEVPHPAGKWRQAWPWLVVNSLSGPALGVACYQWALATTPTGIVLPIVATTPLVIIPFARYVEGESPTPRSLIGGAMAVLGAVALAVA